MTERNFCEGLSDRRVQTGSDVNRWRSWVEEIVDDGEVVGWIVVQWEAPVKGLDKGDATWTAVPLRAKPAEGVTFSDRDAAYCHLLTSPAVAS